MQFKRGTIGRFLKLLVAATCASHSGVALAYTQCTVSISQIFSGDDGYIWLHYKEGGSAYLSPTDPDKQSTLSMAMTALVAGRQMVVRYAADNAPCNAFGRSYLIGVYLN